MLPQRSAAQCQTQRVSPVGPQALAALARPLGPAAKSTGPSVGYGTVDYRENRATSGRITHSKLDRAPFLDAHVTSPGLGIPERGVTSRAVPRVMRVLASNDMRSRIVRP